MASSGFREPQFSEDLAWLPPWLQPLRERVFDDTVGDVQTASQQAFKEIHSNSEKDAILLSSEEARYRNCHLFLSGDDSTQVGTIESFGNQFLHLHLHLSSSGVSEPPQSLDCNFNQTDWRKVTDVLPSQSLAENSPCREKETKLQKVVNEISFANDQVSLKSGIDLNFRVNNLTKSEKYVKPNQIGRYRNLISPDIKDAIELSIAASETLVISEMSKVDPVAEAMSASAILEVALHLKQARNCWCLNGLENVSDCTSDEVDETDQLLDLDEDFMSDALEDVGLSIGGCVGNFGYTQQSGSLIKQECSLTGTLSRVLDTPISVNCEVNSEGQKLEERTENDDSIWVSSSLKSEKVQATNSQVLKKKSSKYDAMRKQLSGDPFLSISDQEISKGTTQAMDMDMVDKFSFTPEKLSPQVQDSIENAGPNGLPQVNRFRSRWLGGWTGLTRKVDATKSKNTPNVVAVNTSFLTQHTGVSDENCSARKLEVEAAKDQLSCKACEISCGTDTKALAPSQDSEVSMSSNSSFIDPLCYVVPCSISIDNATRPSTNNMSLEVGKSSSPLIEHSLEKPHLRITGSCAGISQGNETAVKLNSGTCGVITRRQSASLRKYSTLLAPNIDGFLPKLDSVSLHLSNEIIDWNKSFSKEDSSTLAFSKPTFKVSAGRDCEEGHSISDTKEPIINLTKEKINSDEIADNEGKVQFLQLEERSSPKVLNNGIRQRLQASKIVLLDDVGGVAAPGPKPYKTQNKSTCLDQRKTAEILPLYVNKDQKARKDPSGPRKRVHFSEVEIKKFQRSTRGELQCGDEINKSAVNRPSKRVRKLSFKPDLRTQEVNAFQIKGLGKGRKRKIFQELEFLLTGFSSQKEKELENLIRKRGGFVLSDVPPPPNLRGSRMFWHKRLQLPIILAPKMLQTTKFLYGCVVNSFVLKASWLIDSSMAGYVVQPEKYAIIPFLENMKPKKIGWPVYYDIRTSIFYKVGIMLHGNHNFWAKFGKIIKHGGGLVFKTLQQLSEDVRSGKISTGVIVVEDEGRVSRHLKQCASDEKLPMMTATWIIHSLHVRRLCPTE